MDEDTLQNMNSGRKVACCCSALSVLSVMDISISFCVTRGSKRFPNADMPLFLFTKQIPGIAVLPRRIPLRISFGKTCYREMETKRAHVLSLPSFHQFQ